MVTPGNDGCIPTPKENVPRGSPVPNADAILGSTAVPVHGLKAARDGLSEAITQAIDDKHVPRSSPASGVITPLLFTGSGATKPKVPAGIPADTMVARGVAPLKGLNTNVVTSVSKALEKAGSS
jgi:hypothetical protein